MAEQNPTKEKEYVVVARRYRPTNFQELIGQDQVAQALRNAILSHRVGHAYLFTGARGVGKTSTARIFGKALNCVEGPTPTPCNVCDICKCVSSGEDVDVLEIDGASNRGIEEIRSLRATINVRPSRARFKIYIIDEVHMLTTAAFNALLKTLEEPPEHVKFIFCTTDPEKIPITVLSRCQRFDFPPVEVNSIKGRLADICQQEQVEIDEEALALLARKANGSMRDSQSLLEQLLSFGGNKITLADVHRMLGTAQTDRLINIIDAIVRRSTGEALEAVDRAVHAGIDPGQLAEQLVGFLRDVMVASVGGNKEGMLYSSPGDWEAVNNLAQRLGCGQVLSMLQLLDHTVSRMRQSVHVRTLLEMGIVRLCALGDVRLIEQVVRSLSLGQPMSIPVIGATQQLTQSLTPPQSGSGSPLSSAPNSSVSTGQGSSAAPANAAPMNSGSASTPELVDSKKKELTSESAPRSEIAKPTVTPTSTPSRSDSTTSVQSPPSSAQASAAKPTVQPASQPTNQRPVVSATKPQETADTATFRSDKEAEKIWLQALDRIEDITADLARDFDRVAISGPNKLAIQLKSTYNKEMCEAQERKSLLEQALFEVTGTRYRLDFSASNRPAAVQQTSNSVNRRQMVREIQQHPFVSQTVSIFEADVVDVKPPRKPVPKGDE